jgi:hypothetical protein
MGNSIEGDFSYGAAVANVHKLVSEGGRSPKRLDEVRISKFN